MHSVSLCGLPPETLEQVLLSLPPADILRMKEVNHLFLDFVSSSHHLQYRIGLFSAGLIDDPRVLCDLSQRRAQLRKYVDGWKSPEISTRYFSPLKYSANALHSRPAGQDLFIACPRDHRQSVFFTRIPSPLNQAILEEWKLEFPFRDADYLASSKDNLLVAIERGTGFVNIHLLNLLDGSPHEVPLQSVLPLALAHHSHDFDTSQQISGSRIALAVEFICFAVPNQHTKLIIWDWRTGEVIFSHSKKVPGFDNAISGISKMEFLDETRLLAISNCPRPGLLILDTLLPEGHPRSWRILKLPTPRPPKQSTLQIG